MSTSAAPLPAVRAALSGLIDYAGLFPPAQLDMAGAFAEYACARRGEAAWMLGRFIVPASRMGELHAAIPQGEPCVPLSVILDADWDAGELAAVHDSGSAMRVETLEIPLADDELASAAAALRQSALGPLPAYAEWPRDAGWRAELDATMHAAGEAGLGAKIRCGGIVESAFPAPEEVAAFIFSAHEHRVRFKATAGLHHPIRHFNAASGFTMHGFLNVLFASVLAFGGAGPQTLEACIADEDAREFHFDAQGLRWRDASATLAQIEGARRGLFAGYGSCSFSEPVDDLRGLGLL